MNRGPRFHEMVSGVSSTDEIGFRFLSLCAPPIEPPARKAITPLEKAS
ncbi:hypothetical protein ISS39_01375 [Candidatus Bathyarchaeota archaeon]|nr:hypothetical protein [Candidatus Bathyarchaeota archaeon]